MSKKDPTMDLSASTSCALDVFYATLNGLLPLPRGPLWKEYGLTAVKVIPHPITVDSADVGDEEHSYSERSYMITCEETHIAIITVRNRGAKTPFGGWYAIELGYRPVVLVKDPLDFQEDAWNRVVPVSRTRQNPKGIGYVQLGVMIHLGHIQLRSLQVTRIA